MSTLLILMVAVAIPAFVVAYLIANDDDPEYVPFGQIAGLFLLFDVGGALVLRWALSS